jgi:hypothetical protein
MPEKMVTIEMDKHNNIKLDTNPSQYDQNKEEVIYNAQENLDYVWSEYVKVQPLTLDHSTIRRAREAGIGELLIELSRDVLSAIQQLGIREYNYEDMAKIVGVVQNAISTLQKQYHGPYIEIGSFTSPDTGTLNTVYLSEYGIVLETIDQVNGREVINIDPVEIWRYLYWPSKIVDNVVSTMIAVAEKHKSINHDWILSFQRISDLCQGAEK